EVIFHCRRNFLEVRTTELYAKLEDVVASCGGSNPNPTSNRIGGSSSLALISPVVSIIPPYVPVDTVVPVVPPCVASPSFAADLHNEDGDGCDLGDNRTFGELVATVANSSGTVPRGAQISKPERIEEALRDDEDDEQPEYIAGDRDDDHHSIPAGRSVPSNLEAGAPSQEENDAGVGFGGGGLVDVLTPNEFQIGQEFRQQM
ncbi:hypothetical protein PIB30_054835, partial [Stylosanthes scabra]|nr:hypothetical protein [Stylosanthes scabra]